MVRQRFARNCFSGGGTYSCKKPSNTNKSKMLQTSDMEKRNTEGHNVWSFVLILFLLANMFFWGGDWDPHQEKMYGKEWGSANSDPESWSRKGPIDASWDTPASTWSEAEQGFWILKSMIIHCGDPWICGCSSIPTRLIIQFCNLSKQMQKMESSGLPILSQTVWETLLCQRPCHNGFLRCFNNSGRNLQVTPDPALCTINPYSASRCLDWWGWICWIGIGYDK